MRPFILALDFQHKFWICTDWDKEGKLHKKWTITHTHRITQTFFKNSINEISGNTPIHNSCYWHQTKFDNNKRTNSYILTADPAFMDDNPNLKCYSNLINNNTFCNNISLPLIITNNLAPKICIPEEVKIGISEKINKNEYNTNENFLSNRTPSTSLSEWHITKSAKLVTAVTPAMI